MVKLWIIFALSLLVPGRISPVPDRGGEAPAGLDVVLEFLDQDPCMRECEERPGCMDGQHLVRIQPAEDANTNDPQHTCQNGDCDDHTGGCGTSEEEDLLAVADPSALRYLTRQYLRKVLLNFDRGAFQLLDCAGKVSVHVPVSDALLRDLARFKP